ncbi:NAD-dependent epimerase/dehydratase family protein [Kribbella sp. NPDC049227]|uniref:NAD-dependent epimerase/dehydratase family protein n=1 Tax=Kribbella sp. NPDC049227 TaxID=3364113 RepID=UPI00371F7030
MVVMRIVVVGAAGTLGSALVALLKTEGHEVAGVSRSSEPPVDLSRPESLEDALAALAPFDALVCLGPGTPLRPLGELTPAQLQTDFAGKLFGQIEALRVAATVMTNGVVVLTGGAAPELDGGSGGTTVNAALAAFITAARRELPEGIRAHVVSPGWVTESIPPDWDVPNSTPAAVVAAAYLHTLTNPSAPAVITVP